MKKLLLILICLLSQAAFAQTAWTVQSVPNTRLKGNEIHVSDPDGYLSDSAESAINTALGTIRDKADVFMVTVYSIGSAEPKHFATELFNYWGIGDAETDNGVLLLFVEDQHALEFETGYGAEATLTDATCAQIFNRTIVPYFKAGDYEGGLCAGVVAIVEVYGGEVPAGIMSDLQQNAMTDDDYDFTLVDLIYVLFAVLLLPVPVISFFRWLISLTKYKQEKAKQQGETFEVRNLDGMNFIVENKTAWSGSAWVGKGFIRFLVYGVGLVAVCILVFSLVPSLMPEASEIVKDCWTFVGICLVYNTWICLAQNLMLLHEAKARAKDSKCPKAIYKKAMKDAHTILTWVMAPWLCYFFIRRLKKLADEGVAYYCPTCGSAMEPEAVRPTLSKARTVEEELGVFKHVAYRCSSGHQYVERSQGGSFSSYEYCGQCGAKTVKEVSSKTIKAASYSGSGTKEVTYECKCCGRTFTKTVSIPKLSYSSSSGSGYHSSGRSYSGHSHGSFGGGHSGGGGFSGRW